jgi:hypothetical protein
MYQQQFLFWEKIFFSKKIKKYFENFEFFKKKYIFNLFKKSIRVAIYFVQSSLKKINF